MADLMTAEAVKAAAFLLSRRHDLLGKLTRAKTLHPVPRLAVPLGDDRKPVAELALPAVMEALKEVDAAILDPMLIHVLDSAYAGLLAGIDERLRGMGVEPPAPDEPATPINEHVSTVIFGAHRRLSSPFSP